MISQYYLIASKFNPPPSVKIGGSSCTLWFSDERRRLMPSVRFAFSQKKLKNANKNTKWTNTIPAFDDEKAIVAIDVHNRKIGRWNTLPKLRLSNLYLLNICISYFYLKTMIATRIMKVDIDFYLFAVISKSEGPTRIDLKNSTIKSMTTKNIILIILDF